MYVRTHKLLTSILDTKISRKSVNGKREEEQLTFFSFFLLSSLSLFLVKIPKPLRIQTNNIQEISVKSLRPSTHFVFIIRHEKRVWQCSLCWI